MKTLLVLLLLLVVAGVAVALVLGTRTSKGAKRDVTVTACKAEPGGGKPTASGQIVNHTSKSSNYVVRLRFTDASGNTVSEGVAAVKDVGASAKSSWQLTGDRSAKGQVKCKVSGVSRTHLPGQ